VAVELGVGCTSSGRGYDGGYVTADLAKRAMAETDPAPKTRILAALAQSMRVDTLDVLHAKGTGHWGGASSALEILCSLYFGRMRIDPSRPKMRSRDRFILSKGHASLALYAVLAHRGYFHPTLLGTFRDLGSVLQGHPCARRTPGVDLSTGALGHGLSVGLGLAMGARLRGDGAWTYVMTGEGCLDEGQSWEAAMAAAKFRPERLVLLVDHNGVQLDGPVSRIMPLDPIGEKLSAFGWTVAPRIYDGHDPEAIAQSFQWLDAQDPWPKGVIYRTAKGKGVSFMEGQSQWHGAPVDDESWARARPELLAEFERRLEAARA
jgi:transketolase